MTTRAILCVCLFISTAVHSPAGAAEKAKAVEAMRRTLTKPSISGPVLKAFEQFRKLVGVELEVDIAALAAAGVKTTDTVAVRAARATGEQLLDLMLARLSGKRSPLAWYIDGNTVRVTTQMRVLYRDRLQYRPLRRPSARRPTTRRAKPRTRVRPIREITFDETPLADAIAFLRDASGANIHVNWRSLELIGITRQSPVTLKVSRVTPARALSLVTDQLSISPDKLRRAYWVVDDGVVTVASGAALNTKLRTKVYNVADLLLVVPNFKANRLSVDQQEGTGRNRSSDSGFFGDDDDDDQADEDLPARRQRVRENLIEIIKDAIGQDMWQPMGKGSIRLLADKLVISQTRLGFKLLAEASRPG